MTDAPSGLKPEAWRKKSIVIQATRWFKNGDHPLDYAKDDLGFENGELVTFTGAYRKERDWEGGVVRYFRRPDVDGKRGCKYCERTMHEHGWIDTKEGGHIVCPGDWIITGVMGEFYPCKPDIFDATYEPVLRTPEPKAAVTVEDIATLVWQMRIEIAGYANYPTKTAMINRGASEKIAQAILSQFTVVRK